MATVNPSIPKSFSYNDSVYGTKDGKVYVNMNADGTGDLVTKDGTRRLKWEKENNRIIDEFNSVQFSAMDWNDINKGLKVEVPPTNTPQANSDPAPNNTGPAPNTKPKDFTYTEADGTPVELKFKDDNTAELTRKGEKRTLHLKEGTTNVWTDGFVEITITNPDDPAKNLKLEIPQQPNGINFQKLPPQKTSRIENGKLILSDEDFNRLKKAIDTAPKSGAPDPMIFGTDPNGLPAILFRIVGTNNGEAQLNALNKHRKYPSSITSWPNDTTDMFQKLASQIITSPHNTPLDANTSVEHRWVPKNNDPNSLEGKNIPTRIIRE